MSKDMLGVSVHEARGVVADLLEKLGGRDGAKWLFAAKRFLRKENPWDTQEAVNIFKVIVDYPRSLEEMIAAGKYDRVNSDIIEEHFPSPAIPVGLPAKQELNLELAHFDRRIRSHGALAELKKMGFRPATLPELLAFGEKYPDEQRKYPIVALGSVWRRWGDRSVPFLWSYADERRLFLFWFGGEWRECCRFLAVRESR